MIDVNRLDRFAVIQGVRDRVTDDYFFAEVNRALVVCVVKLSWPNQMLEAWWIDVICNLLFDNADVVTLRFPK